MQRARRVQTAGVPHLVRGAGEHYLPLPNARLVESHAGDDPSDLVVFAPAGTPVHAVCAGTVSDGDDTTLRIEGEDGHTFVYQTVQDRRVAPGERVDAGAIVGVIGAVGDRHVLRLAVTGRGDAPARPHELLLGAVDPNELGYGPAGTGTDLDPDASAASRAAPAAWTSAQAQVAGRSAGASPTRQPRPKPQPTSKPQSSPKPQLTSRPEPTPKPQPSPTTARPTTPAATPPVGAVAPGRRRDPVPSIPDDRNQAETGGEDQHPATAERESRGGTAPTEKKPPVVIPPPPPPVPLLDRHKDETDDEPPAPSATRSEEQQRKRAAMLIASRRRPDDTGPKQ